MQQFISVEAAQAEVLAAAGRLGVERVPIHLASGRVAAEPLVSTVDVPPFDNSAMDGYAVRMADVAALPATLLVAGTVPAGKHWEGIIAPGSCVRIMTGAPVPPGMDAVVPVEWTASEAPTHVQILRAPEPGQHVRRAAKDLSVGDIICPEGVRLTPPGVARLASAGIFTVTVGRRPRVAIISTGDELMAGVSDGFSSAIFQEIGAGHRIRGAGNPNDPGSAGIFDANGPALAAMAIQAGAEVQTPVVAPDDPALLGEALRNAREADVVVLSGGVSVGVFDYVRDLLIQVGADIRFHRVRQRPGKPLLFAVWEGRPVFGLPGNPVSAGICFDQYVRPVLLRMMGASVTTRPRFAARLEAPINKDAGLHHFVRGIASSRAGFLTVRESGPQDSNLIGTLAAANCVVHLPEQLEHPAADDVVEIEFLDA